MAALNIPICTESLITKGDLIPFLIQKMKDQGWVDLASNPANEGYIMRSTGIDGNKNIIIQIRPWSTLTTTDVRTTISVQYAVIPLMTYVPGTTGVNGVSTGGIVLGTRLYATNMEASQINCIVYWYVSPENVVFITRTPNEPGFVPATTQGGGIAFGCPQDDWADKTNKNTYFASLNEVPQWGGTLFPNALYGASQYISFSQNAANAPIPFATIEQPDWLGNYFIRNVVFRGTAQGPRLSLYGIYALKEDITLVEDMDFIVDSINGMKFRVVRSYVTNAVSRMGSNFMAVRVE